MSYPPKGKEGNPMGRSVVDERILCEYSWAICKQGNNNKIHTKSRERKEKLQEDIWKSARAGFWLITRDRRYPDASVGELHFSPFMFEPNGNRFAFRIQIASASNPFYIFSKNGTSTKSIAVFITASVLSASASRARASGFVSAPRIGQFW